MRFFDTHAHLGLIDSDPIGQLIIAKEAKQADVEAILCVCNNLDDLSEVYGNLTTATHVYFAIGISPSEVQHPGVDWEGRIDQGVKLDRVVALGEIGLDYYRKFGNRDSQIELFIRQLEMAETYNLPVVIHNREAGKDILDILDNKIPTHGAVLHCFTEEWSFAERALSRHDNLYISFAGNVTYKNARRLHETAKNMPLERMVIESESPFMVPAPYRGKRNRPFYLPSTAEFIADLRKITIEELSERLYLNSLALFGLEE